MHVFGAAVIARCRQGSECNEDISSFLVNARKLLWYIKENGLGATFKLLCKSLTLCIFSNRLELRSDWQQRILIGRNLKVKYSDLLGGALKTTRTTW